MITPVLHAMVAALFLCAIALSFPTSANNYLENNGILKSPELLLSAKKMNKLSVIVTGRTMISMYVNPFVVNDDVYAVLMNMTEMAAFKESVQQYILNQNDSVSIEIQALNILIEKTIESTCLWLKEEIELVNDVFDCSLNELLELKFHVDALRVLRSLSQSLQSIEAQHGIFHCHHLRDYIFCDDTIAPEIKVLIGQMAKGCTLVDKMC